MFMIESGDSLNQFYLRILLQVPVGLDSLVSELSCVVMELIALLVVWLLLVIIGPLIGPVNSAFLVEVKHFWAT